MDELDEHELGQIQWQHGQCYAVKHGWEKGTEGQTVEERTLAHQIRDRVYV